jgi:death-on-curing protein
VTRYISLAEYLWLAEQVTVTPAETLAKSSRLDLADSALHAPSAGFADDDFYPDPYDKAAVMTCRLAWNHPLMDGNKRAAWAALIMFIDLNFGHWNPDPPNVDEAENAMLAVASHKLNEGGFADWLRARVEFDG